jgi:hypothetical protein
LVRAASFSHEIDPTLASIARMNKLAGDGARNRAAAARATEVDGIEDVTLADDRWQRSTA